MTQLLTDDAALGAFARALAPRLLREVRALIAADVADDHAIACPASSSSGAGLLSLEPSTLRRSKYSAR